MTVFRVAGMHKKQVSLVLIVLFAGCVHYQPEPLSPLKKFTGFQSRSLDDAGLKQFVEGNLHDEMKGWPPKSWDFRTLTLVAFYYHPDLDVARAELGTARAAVISAGVRPNPTLEFSPEYVVNPIERP